MRGAIWLAAMVTVALAGPAAGQPTSIVHTPHNLSSAGAGPIRATAEPQVCVFCHTPHRASPVQPLWNRKLPTSAYTIYASNSLDARPGQPTGASKLCLSCHDGTIALGSVLSRGQNVAMAGGVTTLPPGAANLGTDLSDDHPVSFRYDSALAGRDPKINPPALLPAAVRLDRNQEMQCTSCHDPHSNRYGKFLVMSNVDGQLCKTCHAMGGTDVLRHERCAGCHKNHTAPSGPYLLVRQKVGQTCSTCHGVAGPGLNIAAELNKPSAHETHSPVNQPDPLPRHVSCSSCHEPHTVRAAAATPPGIAGKLGLVGGVNAAGSAVSPARYGYEVCFKCHADRQAVGPFVSRQIGQANTRLEFAPSAVSYHPVLAPGRSRDVPSLRPGLTTHSLIACTDCHNSDTSRQAGGSGPNGPHGSANRPMLIARYVTQDQTSESAAAYALCYRCHERTSVLRNVSFKQHRKHIVDERAPCSVCHDPHGISSAQGTAAGNARLINFDISVVRPDRRTNRLEFNATGARSGSCYLLCHNARHSPKSYSP